MAFDWLNAHGPFSIGGVNYTVHLQTTQCTSCHDPKSISQSYLSLLQDGLNSTNITYYLAPFGSSSLKDILRHPLYLEAERRGSFMLSCSSSDKSAWRDSKSFFSWATPGFRYYAASIPFLRTAGVKTATYVVDTSSPSSSEWCYGLTELLEDNGITLKRTYPIQVSQTIGVDSNISEVEPEVLLNTTKVLLAAMGEENQTDVWFLCARASFQFMPLLYVMKELNYLPNVIVMNSGISNFYRDLSHYVVSSVWELPSVQYPADGYYGTNQEFYDAYKAKYNESLFAFTPTCAVSVFHFMDVLVSVQSFEATKLELGLLKSVFKTAQGSYSFDIFHNQLHEEVLTQIQVKNDEERTGIIGPYSIHQDDLVYPMPKWNERYYNPHFGSEELAVVIIFVLFVILTLISWGYLFIFHRNDWEFRTGNPILTTGMIISSWILLASSLLWPLNYSEVWLCYCSVWFLDIGFVLLIGFISAKIFKVVRIIESSMKLILLKISNEKMLAAVSLLCLVHIILLSVWTALSTIHIQVVVMDPFRPYYNIEYCSYDDFLPILWLLISLDILLYIFCVTYAIRLHRFRNNKNFNESKVIGFGMYNIGFLGCFLVGLELGIRREENLKIEFFFRNVMIFMAIFITLFMIIGFRLKLILCHPSPKDAIERSIKTNKISKEHTNNSFPSETQTEIQLKSIKNDNFNKELLCEKLQQLKINDNKIFVKYGFNELLI
eukprot:TRINITY_DN8565_c0_g1_i2.p1 TRINITY_DN8565_c0_g1~~TRINITY_DN8565_c0_g1_i2.p1  ORF type:complete len:763 (-),score=153.50 TRINITY_DN8565_c0_g1_i2:39-2198(-)